MILFTKKLSSMKLLYYAFFISCLLTSIIFLPAGKMKKWTPELEEQNYFYGKFPQTTGCSFEIQYPDYKGVSLIGKEIDTKSSYELILAKYIIKGELRENSNKKECDILYVEDYYLESYIPLFWCLPFYISCVCLGFGIPSIILGVIILVKKIKKNNTHVP